MPKRLHSDLKRVRALKDQDIVRDGEAPEVKAGRRARAVFFPKGVQSAKEIRRGFEEKHGLDMSFFEHPAIEEAKPAQTISLRIPADLLEWWKSQGKGYQTRIVALMRAYMQHRLKKA